MVAYDVMAGVIVCDSRNALISKLADILQGNQVHTELVLQSLELLCKAASFHCGMVYELDASQQFCLMEQYNAPPIACRKTFPAKEITSQNYITLAQKSISYMVRGTHNTCLETQLLDLFATDALVLAPVVDDCWDTYGYIVLRDITSKEAMPKACIEQFFAPLAMLVRYIGLRMYKRKLNQAQLALERVLDNTGIDIYVNDFDTHDILYVNQSMAKPYGGRTEFVGQKCWRVLFPGQDGPCDFCPQKNLIDEHGEPTKVYTWDYQRAFDGSWFRVFSAAFRWVDGRLAHVVSSADITDNKRNEAIIENLANYDQLTKLPNRRMLLRDCEKRINAATAKERGYVLFFDIDNFKSINDTLGHDAGDEFLIQLGEFFSHIPLLNNAIYRNGGDEFVAIVSGENITKSNIQSLAHFIHERFKQPWKLKMGESVCNVSIGVSCYPEDGDTVEVLLQKADMAMYQIKKSGGGRLGFGNQ